MSRFRHAAACCVWLLISTGSPVTLAAVTACTDADGLLTYTQFDCPAGSEASSVPDGEGSLTILRTTPLDPSERAALDRLARRLAADRDRRKRVRRAAAARQHAERSAARQRCEAAERALDALAETRRQGYTAAEDRRYDAEEARWNAVRRADC